MNPDEQDGLPAWRRAGVVEKIRIRFAETDLMGVVHHSAYIVWFEIGRIAWMSAAGMPYAEIAAAGRHFAVTALEAEYRAAVRFGDTVSIRTYLAELRSRKIAFCYEVLDDVENVLLATGRSEHICVDLGGSMASIPSPVIARLKQGGEMLAREDADR